MTTFLLSLLQKHVFTKTIAILALTNLTSMVIANFLRITVYDFVLFYLLLLPVATHFVNTFKLKSVPCNISNVMALLALLFATLLALLRAPYLFDISHDYTIKLAWDDRQRVVDLASMVCSESFPLKFCFNKAFIYSYYYLGLIPWMVLKLLLPALTFKAILFFGYAFYLYISIFALLEIANRYLDTTRSLWTMFFLCTVYGGLDWLYNVILNGSDFIAPHEWWQRTSGLFHGDNQISTLFIIQVFTPQHLLGLLTILVAHTFWFYTFARHKAEKIFVVGLLMISAFYTSAFIVFPLSLFLVAELKSIIKICKRYPLQLFTLSIVSLMPLYILTANNGDAFKLSSFAVEFTNSFAANKLFSFPIWLLLIIAFEFCFIPIFILYYFNSMPVREKKYTIASYIFLLSTYFIAGFGGNYSMRGMLIPGFVIIIIFCKYAANNLISKMNRIVIALILIFLSTGTILEYARYVSIIFRSVSYNPVYAIDSLENRDSCGSLPHKEIEELKNYEKERYRVPRSGLFR